ncbi:MAG: MarR family transcriptional regulator [Alphaproteobacteria bacterium]
MKQGYLETIGLIERLHRQFLEVVKAELDRLGIQDINNVQSLILYNIADDEVTVGELTNRGYYLGSNVSYNLKKMVEYGYLEQERSLHDRRSFRVRLSGKGTDLRNKIAAMFESHSGELSGTTVTAEGLATTGEALRGLERFWTDVLNNPNRAQRDDARLRA